MLKGLGKIAAIVFVLLMAAAAAQQVRAQLADEDFAGNPTPRVAEFLNVTQAFYAAPANVFIGEFAPVDLAKLVGYSLRRQNQNPVPATSYYIDNPAFQQEIQAWMLRYEAATASYRLWPIVIQAARGVYDQEVEQALQISPPSRQ